MQSSRLCADNLNDCFDLINKPREHRVNRSYADSARPLSVAESYCNGDVILAFHVAGRRLDGERHEFSAIYKFAIVPSGVYRPMWRRDTEVDVPALLPINGYVQIPVFVSVIKVADELKKRRQKTVGSIVRLYRLDACPHCRAQGFNSPLLIRERTGIVGDGKLENAFAGGRIGAGFLNSDSVDEMVESRSQVMNTISADQRPSVEIAVQRPVEVDDEPVITTLDVSLRGDLVSVNFSPIKDFFVDRVGQFNCTTDLQPTIL